MHAWVSIFGERPNSLAVVMNEWESCVSILIKRYWFSIHVNTKRVQLMFKSLELALLYYVYLMHSANYLNICKSQDYVYVTSCPLASPSHQPSLATLYTYIDQVCWDILPSKYSSLFHLTLSSRIALSWFKYIFLVVAFPQHLWDPFY